MRDLSNPQWIKLKGLLFFLLGTSSAVLLLVEAPVPRVALLLMIAIWAFCRAYYFAFYVIEHYVDPTYRFSGILSFLRYITSRRANSAEPPRVGSAPHDK
jgi:hypothetical protein